MTTSIAPSTIIAAPSPSIRTTPTPFASLAALLTFLGNPEEGIDRLREAMRLNPYHPDWYWSDLSLALYAKRRYDEAIEAFAADGAARSLAVGASGRLLCTAQPDG
jgi:tetratricopeptide (TPR) repeat protein